MPSLRTESLRHESPVSRESEGEIEAASAAMVDVDRDEASADRWGFTFPARSVTYSATVSAEAGKQSRPHAQSGRRRRRRPTRRPARCWPSGRRRPYVRDRSNLCQNPLVHLLRSPIRQVEQKHRVQVRCRDNVRECQRLSALVRRGQPPDNPLERRNEPLELTEDVGSFSSVRNE
jgi:hypothetical protein